MFKMNIDNKKIPENLNKTQQRKPLNIYIKKERCVLLRLKRGNGDELMVVTLI